MTNLEIIYSAQVELAEQGILNVQDDEIEDIHTFAAWKKLGYKVKKGEKAIVALPIWNYSKKKVLDENNQPVLDENGDETYKSSMYMKTAHFFSASQVEKEVK